jgi:hypothetical protein
LQEGINESRYEARQESSETRDVARMESSKLQTMIGQLIQHINNNSSQTEVSSVEKRKHDAKTPSSNPEDKDMTSPDHRK